MTAVLKMSPLKKRLCDGVILLKALYPYKVILIVTDIYPFIELRKPRRTEGLYLSVLFRQICDTGNIPLLTIVGLV